MCISSNGFIATTLCQVIYFKIYEKAVQVQTQTAIAYTRCCTLALLFRFIQNTVN